MWQCIRYSCELLKLWVKWLRARFRIANHLTTIVCFISYKKWVQIEMFSNNTHLPYIREDMSRGISDLREICSGECHTNNAYADIIIPHSMEHLEHIPGAWRWWRRSCKPCNESLPHVGEGRPCLLLLLVLLPPPDALPIRVFVKVHTLHKTDRQLSVSRMLLLLTRHSQHFRRFQRMEPLLNPSTRIFESLSRNMQWFSDSRASGLPKTSWLRSPTELTCIDPSLNPNHSTTNSRTRGSGPCTSSAAVLHCATGVLSSGKQVPTAMLIRSSNFHGYVGPYF